MQRRRTTIALSLGVILVMATSIAVGCRRTPDTYDHHAFDWKVVGKMITSGVLSNERYSVEEVPLRHLQMSDAKIFFVVDRQFEARLGPMQAIVVYYPQAKVLDHDPEHLRMFIQGIRYKLNSPDELLQLAGEIVPLWYGSKPAQHEILTECSMVASGALPITKETFQSPSGPGGMFVNYYAKIGPWGDIVCVTVVLQEERLSITLAPVYLAPRMYE